MTPTQPVDASVLAGLEQLARAELSWPRRLAHVLLALGASAMTIVVLSLWMTEPALPARTSTAFAILALVGSGWVGYSLWVLNTTRVMLARQRVVAGRLAVTFTAVFAAGCVLVGWTTGQGAAWPALAMGVVLLAAALVVWRRAERAHANLLARRDALERKLTGR